MRRKLFTVKDVFKVAGRGLVLAGDRQADLPQIKIGDAAVLIAPDKTEKLVEVAGFESFQSISGFYKGIAVLIQNLTKADVPIGTEVFLETADEPEN